MSTIANNCVVEIHYTLKNDKGEILDSTEGFSPLAYIQGKQNIIPGLEKALVGKKSGDALQVTIPAAEAYGVKNPNLVQTVSKTQFGNPEQIKMGMQFRVQNENGQSLIVQITNIDDENVTLDGNHPLAGVDLFFDVNVASIRAATEEELEHGHLHMGAGCCGGGSGGCGSSCGDGECC